MTYRKSTFTQFAALMLMATTISAVGHESLKNLSALAQQSFGDNPEGFPIPSSLPEGTSLSLDGSTSMEVTNQELESRFESQYPDVDVALDASNTDEAIQALLDGEVDLVATGRPLTDEEKAQGLIEVPLEREKLAILLGPDNPFEGNLTFEQFAQIFRGEITNWSEVGGPDLPIRVVDRPDFSDTRRALSTYEVFQGQPFETGTTADPVAEDETEAVINSLGNDGIGYAVYSQVEGVEDVQVLPMHETLPNDPRYPYSQYRAYVYTQDSDPAAIAFLGFATTAPGEEVITEVEVETVPPETAEEPIATEEAVEPEEPIEEATIEQEEEEAVALAPDAAATGDTQGGFPWWWLLLPLLLLGGLFWWLSKGKGGAAPAAAPAAAPVAAPPPQPDPRLILTPRNCKDAYAYWEVSDRQLKEVRRQDDDKLMLRLYDVTSRAPGASLPTHTAEYPCVNPESDLHIPVPVDDRKYQAELGYLTQDERWLPVAKSDPVQVPACPKPATLHPPSVDKEAPPIGKPSKVTLPGVGAVGAAAGAAALGAAAVGARGKESDTTIPPSRIVLTPRNENQGFAYWEVPDQAKARAKAEGGKDYQLRIYDVTDIDIQKRSAHSTSTYSVAEVDSDRFVPLPETNRDYIADIGYEGDDGSWLSLAKSEPVRIDTVLGQDTRPDSALKLGGAAAAGLGAAAIGAAAAGIGGQSGDKDVAPSRVILTPRNEQQGYAFWEVPDQAKAKAKAGGWKDYQLRIYDATDIDIAKQPAHSTAVYPIAEIDSDRFVPLPETNRDYIADIGYQGNYDSWLSLAKSEPVRIDTVLGQGTDSGIPLGKVGAVAAGAGAAAIGAAALGSGDKGSKDTTTANRIELTPRNDKIAHAYWEISNETKAKAKADGGREFQLRIHDATDVDLSKQPAHGTLTYSIAETDNNRSVPLPEVNRDYIADIGYRGDNDSWISLAKSEPFRIDRDINPADKAEFPVGGVGAVGGAALGGAIAAGAGALGSTPPTKGQCSIQTVQVHSRHNALFLDQGQMNYLQDAVSVKASLDPGQYILRIRDGVFNYDGDDTHPGEPFVLLWVYGGIVVNQKTGVPVNATWSTLNGYADTLVLNVQEPAQICAFFLDTYSDDNTGEVTLSVIKL